MSVTIRDIAKRLNLSKSTVSYALGGESTKVSPELRAKIRALAKELNFHPNSTAQSLARGRTRAIGFVPHQWESGVWANSYEQVAFKVIFQTAHRNGMHLLLPSRYDPQEPDETRANLLRAPVDGIVMFMVRDQQLLNHLRSGRPLMVIGGSANGAAATACADDYGGACQAFDHLYELGHRQIGVIGQSSVNDTAERLRAYLDRVRERDLEIDPHWIVQSASGVVESGYVQGLKMLSHKSRPTAIVCVNDHVACGLLRAAHEMGIKVPHELSLVGFDDDVICGASSIPITTVHYPIAEMASAAFQGVLDQLEGKPVESQVFPTSLIVRATTTQPLKQRTT